MTMMVLHIDGRDARVPHGATLLDAARSVGVAIPTMCHRDGCRPGTSCMVCVVRVEGLRRLVPACAYPARDGMVVHTGTDEVTLARRTAVELLLGEHVGDCEGPCRRGCPAAMNIPLMLRQIAAGNNREALITVRRKIALPAVLGWVCPAPCERNCRRRSVDEPVAICLSKRFAGEARKAGDLEWGLDVAPATGKRVAIVGGGPAGLACAVYLRLRGHAVRVYESGAAAGGQLRMAIPESRLPRAVLDADIEAIRRTGVEFQCNTRVGVDVALAALREQFDAVVLATGGMEGDRAMDCGVERTARGIKVQAGTFQTAEAGLFAIGGAISPLKMAVRACADGRAAAWCCHLYLTGVPVAGELERFDSMIGQVTESELRELLRGANEAGRVELAGGVSGGLGAEEAVREAKRCMRCDCRKSDECELRRMAEKFGAHGKRFRPESRAPLTITDDHPEVVYEPGKCTRCGLCVRLTEKAGCDNALTFAGRGSATVVCPPVGVAFREVLGDSAALVVEACPTGALSWKKSAGK